MYTVYVRNWWKENPAWPNGLEPDPSAKKTTLAKNIADEDEARAMCMKYNATHPAGRLSRKAEYKSQ